MFAIIKNRKTLNAHYLVVLYNLHFIEEETPPSKTQVYWP